MVDHGACVWWVERDGLCVPFTGRYAYRAVVEAVGVIVLIMWCVCPHR